MEHWFDTLSRPQTRRSALKAALGIAAAGIALPGLRPELAFAADREPCFKPCLAAATRRFNTMLSGCEQLLARTKLNMLSTSVAPEDLLIRILDTSSAVSCLASAELRFALGVAGCRSSGCGDGDTGPGGSAPPKPTCDPKDEILCVDTCCSTTSICCPSSEIKCWSTNHVC